MTGDRFVQARELSLFTAIYDPRRILFRRHFHLGRFPIVTGVLAALVPGLVTIVSGGNRESYIVPGGFLEASRGGDSDDYHVIILADGAEPAGDIDAAEARRRIEEAKKKADEDSHDRRSEAELAAALAGPELGRD